METGISGLGSPRKATNVWSKSVRINFCRTLKSSLKKKKSHNHLKAWWRKELLTVHLPLKCPYISDWPWPYWCSLCSGQRFQGPEGTEILFSKNCGDGFSSVSQMEKHKGLLVFQSTWSVPGLRWLSLAYKGTSIGCSNLEQGTTVRTSNGRESLWWKMLARETVAYYGF